MFSLILSDKYTSDVRTVLNYIKDILFAPDASNDLDKAIEAKLDEIQKNPYRKIWGRGDLKIIIIGWSSTTLFLSLKYGFTNSW